MERFYWETLFKYQHKYSIINIPNFQNIQNVSLCLNISNRLDFHAMSGNICVSCVDSRCNLIEYHCWALTYVNININELLYTRHL